MAKQQNAASAEDKQCYCAVTSPPTHPLFVQINFPSGMIYCPFPPFFVSSVSSQYTCSGVQQWGSSAVDGCNLDLTWREVNIRESLSPPTAWTGGLGKLMTDEVEVWVCMAGHRCAHAGVPHDENNIFCFVYHELHDVFIPWCIPSLPTSPLPSLSQCYCRCSRACH